MVNINENTLDNYLVNKHQRRYIPNESEGIFYFLLREEVLQVSGIVMGGCYGNGW